MQGERAPGRGRSQCKGPGVGIFMECLSVAAAEGGVARDHGSLGLVSAAGFALRHVTWGRPLPATPPFTLHCPSCPEPRAGSSSSPALPQVNRQQGCSSGSVSCSDLSLHQGGGGDASLS